MASSAHLLFLIILTLSPLASLGDIPELNNIVAELNGDQGDGGHGGDNADGGHGGGNVEGANLDKLAAKFLGGAGDGGEPVIAICMPKLLPCKDFINTPNPPTETCCGPLKEIIKDDAKCLCQVVNNPSLLKSFNVTKEELLKFPKACDAQADLSICNQAPAPSPSMPLPTIPKDPSTNAHGGESDDKKNSAGGLSMLGGYGVITLFISLFIPGAF